MLDESGERISAATVRYRIVQPERCWLALEAAACDLIGTAMGWAIEGAGHQRHGISTGKHGDCARLLLAAGADVDPVLLPAGVAALDQVLRLHFAGR